MYPIGQFAEIASIIYAGVGIFMAHTLYKSPRKRWQCVAAWAGIIVFCTMVGEVLDALLPQYAQQRIAVFTGCLFILVYIYLFPDIPLPQRVFAYFLADDCMYLLVLLGRTVTMLAVNYWNVDALITFPIVYLLLVTAFCIAYVKWLRAMILRGLSAFEKNLTALALFSAVCYLGTLFLMDAWKPWQALTVMTALPPLGLIAINIAGYLLAFRTLAVAGQRLAAQSDAKMAQMQLAAAEKEYHATMEGMDQVRRMRHDMNHHLAAIAALISKEDKEGAQEYIAKAAALLPQRALTDENPITASFVTHYRELCDGADIAFSGELSYPEAQIPNKVHLGILLGNSLQNAYDGAREATEEGRFLSVEGKCVYDNFILTVKNGFSGTPNPSLKTTKGEGHGLGLASMRSVVEEYDGYMDISQEGGVFTLSIVLPLSK